MALNNITRVSVVPIQTQFSGEGSTIPIKGNVTSQGGVNELGVYDEFLNYSPPLQFIGGKNADGTSDSKINSNCYVHHPVNSIGYPILNASATKQDIISHLDFNSLVNAIDSLLINHNKGYKIGYKRYDSDISLDSDWNNLITGLSNFGQYVYNDQYLTATFYNDLVNKYNLAKAQCLCNSDCSCNFVCACNVNCGCNYT